MPPNSAYSPDLRETPEEPAEYVQQRVFDGDDVAASALASFLKRFSRLSYAVTADK